MRGVIVVDAGRSRSTCLRRDAYIHDHCLDIIMIIWSSINCPTVICLPTACYFSWEKPLVKYMAPGSLLNHICLWDLFLFAFIFRSINPKIQKYLAAIFSNLFYLAFPWDLFIQSTTILPVFLPIRDRRPLSYIRLQVFVLIIEGNTYCCCAASSLPLWGNTDAVEANITKLVIK